MTRTDVVASSRPHSAGAGRTTSRASRSWRRRLALPVLLLAVALVVPATALAATEEGLSTYNETKTTTSAAEPTQSTAPATATAPAKELPKTSTLPFTGLDLGNVVLVGFLLIGAGTSIVVVQRRRSGRSEH